MQFNKIRCSRILNILIINLRYLLGFAFLPSGIKKINGIPFTNLDNSGPFFDYFDALYATGYYYNMIGWFQVVAAVLLITQRFATIGTFIYLPIIFNISILTLSIDNSFTPVIAALMLTGCLFLLFWDYYKWKYIFYGDNYKVFSENERAYPSYNSIWIFGGVFLLMNFLIVGPGLTVISKGNNDHISRAGGIIWLLIMVMIPVVATITNEIRFRKKQTEAIDS